MCRETIGETGKGGKQMGSSSFFNGEKRKKYSDKETGTDCSNGRLQDPNSSLFIEGEKVLAYHASRIYEAKVLLSLFMDPPFFN